MISTWLRWRARLDRIAAAALAVATAPVIAVLAVLIRRDGEAGAGLIRLPRAGYGTSTVRVWKLRTMRATHPDGAAGGTALTRGDDDSRITTVGRVLRRHRLDELPQVWNVIAGDMALIGPRPESLDYVEHADPRWCAVLAARPGIVGATQLLVEGWERTAMRDASFEHTYVDQILPVKLAIDEWYVRSASLAIDVSIVRALVARFVLGRAPSALQRRVRASVPEAAQIPPS